MLHCARSACSLCSCASTSSSWCALLRRVRSRRGFSFRRSAVGAPHHHSYSPRPRLRARPLVGFRGGGGGAVAVLSRPPHPCCGHLPTGFQPLHSTVSSSYRYHARHRLNPPFLLPPRHPLLSPSTFPKTPLLPLHTCTACESQDHTCKTRWERAHTRGPKTQEWKKPSGCPAPYTCMA